MEAASVSDVVTEPTAAGGILVVVVAHESLSHVDARRQVNRQAVVAEKPVVVDHVQGRWDRRKLLW